MGDHRGRDVVHPRRKKKTNVLKSMWQGLKDEEYQDPQSCGSNSHSGVAKMESKSSGQDTTRESEASQFTIKENKKKISGDCYKEKQPAKGYHSSPLSFFRSAADDAKARRMNPQNATDIKRDDGASDATRRNSQDISNRTSNIQGKCYKYDPESSSLREGNAMVVPKLVAQAEAGSGRGREEISHDNTKEADEDGMSNQKVAKVRGQAGAIARQMADEDKDVKKLRRQWKDVGIRRPIQRHSHSHGQTLTAPAAAVMDAEDAIAKKLIREDSIRKQGKNDESSKGRFRKALAGISKADAERSKSSGKHRVLMFLAPKRASASQSKIKAECVSSTTSKEGQDDDRLVDLATGIPMPKNPAGAYETAPNDTLTPQQPMRRQPQPQRHSLPPGAYPVAPATAQQEQEGEATHLPATAREEESERSMADEEWTIRSSRSSLPQAKPVQEDEEEEESSSRLRQLQESFADQETQMEQMQQQLAQLQHVQAELAQFKQAMPKAEPVSPRVPAAAPRPEQSAKTNVGRPSLKQKKQRNHHRDGRTEKAKRPSGMTEKEWGAYQYLIGAKQQL